MNKEVKVHQTTTEIPETVKLRFLNLEKELTGFDTDRFVKETLQEALDEKERQENLVLDWDLTPVYVEEPSLQ